MGLRLKVRLLQAEAIETMLHGCVTCSPNPADYGRLRQVYRLMLLRCLGWWKRKCVHYNLSYARALAKIYSDSIEVTVRKTRVLFAGFAARIGEEHLPRVRVNGN